MTFNGELNLKERVTGWQFILEEDFAIEQVLYALKKYMKENETMPVPASIVKILKPEATKIQQSEYIAALDYQKRHGYPQFSPEAILIREYRQQQDGEKKNYAITCNKVKAVLSGSVKKIEKM